MQNLKTIVKSRETYFILLFVVNAIAANYGFNQFVPDANVQALLPVVISVVGIVASALTHPVIKSQSVEVDTPKGIADAGKPK